MGNSKSKGTKGGVNYRAAPSLSAISVGASSNQAVKLSKDVIEFKLTKETLTATDDITITNNSDKKIGYSFEPAPTKAATLVFKPAKGKLGKSPKDKTKKIQVVLTAVAPENLNFKVTLKADTGEEYFLQVRVRSDVGVFGCDPTTLPQVSDNGYNVPEILASMRKSLVDNGALTSEGIFRLAGDAKEIKELKDMMNKKAFTTSNDINSIASLTKIWYRELPNPILNSVSVDTIFHSDDPAACIAAYDQLPQPQKDLLGWLVDLLLAVAANSSVNKMTPQNLAIVVAPNLYEPPTPDPMESLVLSQKCVQFFHNIIMHKIQQRQAALAPSPAH